MSAEWAKLNGYVDGELDTATAAEVASAIALDPQLAQQAAALHRLKAVAASLKPAERAPQLPGQLRRSNPFNRFAWMTAAAAVLMLICGVVAFTRLTTSDGTSPFDQAFRAQQQWLSSGAVYRPSALGLDAAIIADLADANLKVVYASAEGTALNAPRLIGFEGPHGCKLGLWVAQLSDTSPVEVINAIPPRAGIRAVSWRSTQATYVLMAKGMDAERFDRYARAISTLLLHGPKTREQDRIALRSATQSGAPCQA